MSLPQFASADSTRNNRNLPQQDMVLLGDYAADEPRDPDCLKKYRHRRGEQVLAARSLFQDGNTSAVGGVGSGKSSQVLGPLAESLMQPYKDARGALRRDPVIVIDPNDDTALFWRTRRCADALRRRFLQFSLEPERSLSFNPLQFSGARKIRVANLLKEGLGANSKEEYFKGQNVLQVLRFAEAMVATNSGPPTLASLKSLLADTTNVVENSDQIRTSLELLLQYPQLLPAQDPAHNIQLREALQHGAVIYLHCYAVGEHETAADIAGMFIYCVLNAVLEMKYDEQRVGPLPRPHLIIDEFHMFAGPHLEVLWGLLRKIASLHVAYQSTAQLSPSMATLVAENSFCRFLMTLTTEADFREIELHSKETKNNWLESEQDTLGGGLSRNGRLGGTSRSQFRDFVTTRNTIKEVSMTKNLFFIILKDGQGHREPIIATRQHTISLVTHLDDKETPIPVIGATFATTLPLATVSAPLWQRQHAEPVAGKRATWQSLMGQLIGASVGPGGTNNSNGTPT